MASWAKKAAIQGKRRAKQRMQPAQQVFRDYYRPAYEQAYQSAENMGINPSLYGQQRAAERQQESMFNRMGMTGTGAAMAGRQQLAQDWAMRQQQAAADAAQRRYDAFRGLAGDAYSAGAGATQIWQTGQRDYQNYLAQAEARNDQEKAQREAAAGAGFGRFAGGLADLGLTYASGGAYAPIAGMTGGFSGMLGGQQGTTYGGDQSSYNQYYNDPMFVPDRYSPY